MKAICTVRLKKTFGHDILNKMIGKCPLGHDICTDLTGEHHSYIESGKNINDIKANVKCKGFHLTRLEMLND